METKNLRKLPELHQAFNIGEDVWVNYKNTLLNTQVVSVGFDSETLELKYEVAVFDGVGSAWYPENLIFEFYSDVKDSVIEQMQEREFFCWVEGEPVEVEEKIVHSAADAVKKFGEAIDGLTEGSEREDKKNPTPLMEDFLAPEDHIDLNARFYALYAGLRMFKEYKDKQNEETSVNVAAMETYEMLVLLDKWYPEQYKEAHEEYEMVMGEQGSCPSSCTPSDYGEGGKCDEMGCYEKQEEPKEVKPIEDLYEAYTALGDDKERWQFILQHADRLELEPTYYVIKVRFIETKGSVYDECLFNDSFRYHEAFKALFDILNIKHCV